MREIEEQILKCLLESRKSFWELLNENKHTVKDFVATINELFKKGFIGVEGDSIYLTEKGLEKTNEKIREFKSAVCDKCEGNRIVFDGKFKEISEKFVRIVKDRPLPSVDFFQGYMREKDVISRIALMHYYNDLADKSFILIGDDDLLSVALALTELPSKIFVLEIDERLGEYIGKVSKEHGLEIEFQKYDVSNPLPKDLVGKFDVFSSEPLETVSGLKAFISRGVACLKDGGVGYVGLSTAEASRRKWLTVERMLLEMNCVVTDIIRDFSKYGTLYENVSYEKFTTRLKFPVKENPGICWYKSSLFRFEVMGEPKPLIKPSRRVSIKYVDWREDITNPLLYE